MIIDVNDQINIGPEVQILKKVILELSSSIEANGKAFTKMLTDSATNIEKIAGGGTDGNAEDTLTGAEGKQGWFAKANGLSKGQQAKLENIQKKTQAVAGILSNASKATDELEKSKLDKLEGNRKKELDAAGNDAVKKNEINERYEREKLEIQKKYADVGFGIKVSEIIANTAVAVMKAIGELGFIGGGIAGALIIATGATQIAAANKERQKVKSMTVGSSSTASASSTQGLKPFADGGFTANVGDNDAAGIVHGNEYVVPAWQLRQAPVMDMVRVIESQRRARSSSNTGSISSSSNTYNSYGGSDASISGMIAMNNALMRQLIDKGIHASVALTEIQAKQNFMDRAKEPFSKK